MKIIVSAMHRSGINAIGKWLLRQSSLKNKELYGLYGDWVEYYGDKDWESVVLEIEYSFISQINHPEHSKDVWPTFLGRHTVMTIERESATQAEQFCKDNIKTKWDHIFVVRSFNNWLASIAKAHITALNKDPNNSILRAYRVHQDVEKYRTYLDRLKISDNIYDLFSKPDFSPYTIFYDSWVKSAEYRKGICRDLGLR